MNDPTPNARELDELVRKARDDDADAIDRLSRIARPLILHYVSRHMGRHARRWSESGDIAQRVLFEAVHGLRRLPADIDWARFKGHFYKLTDWRIRDAVRNQKHRQGESAFPGSPKDVPVPPPSVGPVTERDGRVWVERLVAEHLRPQYAEVVRMVLIEGLTFAEIGRRLGKSADSVRKAYGRARRALEEAKKTRV